MMQPTVVVQQTMAPMPAGSSKEVAWKNPEFPQVDNDCNCLCRPTLCFGLKSKELHTIQGKQCEVPSCDKNAVTTCHGDVKFCAPFNGPTTWSGCGRALCQHHVKYMTIGQMQGEVLACDNAECGEEAKSAMAKFHCLVPCLCAPFNTFITACGKPCIGAPRRYRDKNGNVQT
jgi:hypothetical protein